MADFEAAVAPFRRELLAHCYQMLGSLADAEDALQDSLVRAWHGLPGFEGRTSLRRWLYKVATNTCLTAIERRKARSLPHLEVPAGQPGDVANVELERWLEPFPDALIGDPDARPDAIYSRREAVRLAFVAALQRLPARQRAVVILRDVVALSADETAEALELSVAAVNSLLQRAREALAGTTAARSPIDDALLARYVAAWEQEDADALIAVLRDDAIASMPPSALWVRGKPAIVACMRALVWTGGALRLVRTAANDAPAFGVYQDRGGTLAFAALSVVEVEAGAVAAVHSFLATDPRFSPARYGLPAALAPRA